MRQNAAEFRSLKVPERINRREREYRHKESAGAQVPLVRVLCFARFAATDNCRHCPTAQADCHSWQQALLCRIRVLQSLPNIASTLVKRRQLKLVRIQITRHE